VGIVLAVTAPTEAGAGFDPLARGSTGRPVELFSHGLGGSGERNG
jgi:hypothetical protein